MKVLIHITILLIAFSVSGNAQLTVDQKIVMTSSDSLQRTVKGLHYSNDSSAMVSVLELISNRLIFSETADDDTLMVNLPITTSITEGSLMWIQNSVNTDAGLLISRNGTDFYPVMTDVFTAAGNDCIKQNEIEFLVFDGVAFYELFEGYNYCPSGFVEVNEKYCIQVNENTSANYWNAVSTCESMNAKLCSWGEWYHACQKAGLGLTNITNNWEWSESANNHATSVLILGNASCDAAGESNTQITQLRPYRCCYRRK